MTDRIRIAQIGCGAWGRNLLRVLSGMGAVDVRCVIDPNPAALQTAHALAPGAALCSRLDALGRDPFDAVIVASPVPMHAAHARAALEAGADVFVEKPLATSVRDAVSLDRMASQRGRVGMVGHLLHYHPAVAAMLATIRQGVCGAPIALHSERCSVCAHTSETSLLWSLAPHDLSLLRALDPSPIVSMSIDVLRSGAAAYIQARTAQGLDASVLIARSWERKVRRMIVVCENGQFVFDDALDEGKLVFESGCGPSDQLVYERTEPLRVEMETFARCVQTRRAPPTDFAQGVAVVKLLAQVEECMSPARCRPPLFDAR